MRKAGRRKAERWMSSGRAHTQNRALLNAIERCWMQWLRLKHTATSGVYCESERIRSLLSPAFAGLARHPGGYTWRCLRSALKHSSAPFIHNFRSSHPAVSPSLCFQWWIQRQTINIYANNRRLCFYFDISVCFFLFIFQARFTTDSDLPTERSTCPPIYIRIWFGLELSQKTPAKPRAFIRLTWKVFAISTARSATGFLNFWIYWKI